MRYSSFFNFLGEKYQTLSFILADLLKVCGLLALLISALLFSAIPFFLFFSFFFF
jgi:hypothetical protein